MELNRQPTTPEKRLLEFLIKTATRTFPPDCLEDLIVRNMNDSGMGSLELFPKGVIIKEERSFGAEISEYQFKDRDGIEVSVALNVDDNGNLFELDIWKEDFSKLIEIPDVFLRSSP